jgi:hypothetical protein
MNHNTHLNRRQFLEQTAVAGTGVAAILNQAPALLASKHPNDVIGVACIGVGTQGHYLLQNVQAVPNTEVRVISDLYEGNRIRARKLCTNPKVRFVLDWEKAVQDPDIDAVIIATPDFWHAPMVSAAARAKKDIYVEKGWCTRLEDAKKMRTAVKDSRVVMQLGHHYNSLPSFHKARDLSVGHSGKVPLVGLYRPCCRVTGMEVYTDYRAEMPRTPAQTPSIDVLSRMHPSGPLMLSGFSPGAATGTTGRELPAICSLTCGTA